MVLNVDAPSVAKLSAVVQLSKGWGERVSTLLSCGGHPQTQQVAALVNILPGLSNDNSNRRQAGRQAVNSTHT